MAEKRIKNSRLIVHHLHLSLKASAIVLTRSLEIIVHSLHVGHEIRET